MGMATYFGNGDQWFSWISMADLIGMFVFALEENQIDGTYNAVAPDPKRNKEFTKILRDVQAPRAILTPVPGLALKLGMGEMSSLVLGSSLVDSSKISQTGFNWETPQLEDALKAIFP